MDSEIWIGVDIGGTAIKAGAVRPDGSVVKQLSTPIELAQGHERVLDQIAELVTELGGTSCLGVGCAGLIDRPAGSVSESPNLGALVGAPLVDGIASRLDLPPAAVLLENDANVAALGEQWQGAAQGVDDTLVVTLGTGIGGGLILGGRLYSGPRGMAGEVGHLVMIPGLGDASSGPGILERLSSATAARQRAREAGLTEDLEALCATARESAGPERRLLHEIGVDLGRGLGSVEALLDIEVFVFAGGFSPALDVLEPGIHEGMAERRFGTRQAQLRRASLGGNAGWIGAARLAGLS